MWGEDPEHDDIAGLSIGLLIASAMIVAAFIYGLLGGNL